MRDPSDDPVADDRELGSGVVVCIRHARGRAQQEEDGQSSDQEQRGLTALYLPATHLCLRHSMKAGAWGDDLVSNQERLNHRYLPTMACCVRVQEASGMRRARSCAPRVTSMRCVALPAAARHVLSPVPQAATAGANASSLRRRSRRLRSRAGRWRDRSSRTPIPHHSPHRTRRPRADGQPELLPKRNDLPGNLHVFVELPVKNLLTNPLSVHPASFGQADVQSLPMLTDDATRSVWFGAAAVIGN